MRCGFIVAMMTYDQSNTSSKRSHLSDTFVYKKKRNKKINQSWVTYTDAISTVYRKTRNIVSYCIHVNNCHKAIVTIQKWGMTDNIQWMPSFHCQSMLLYVNKMFVI